MSRDPFEQKISASRIRIRRQAPFFATLSLFAEIRPSDEVPGACIDGVGIHIHPAHLESLTPRQVDGLLVHQILHAALLHGTRRGPRDPALWSVAADIVTNGVLSGLDWLELPPGSIQKREIEHLSVEEVYALLAQSPPAYQAPA